MNTSSEQIRDRALFFLLACVIAAYFLINLPSAYHDLEASIFTVTAAIGFISGAVAVTENRRAALTAGILTTAMLAFRFLSFISEDPSYEAASVAVTVLLLTVIVMRLSTRVFDNSRVTPGKLAGAVVIYLLIGALWGNLYTLILACCSDAFQFNVPPMDFYAAHRQLVYYSFITLTTVGFGDVTALTPFARSLTVLEACIGVLFPNILIARLVALEITFSSQSKP